MNIFGGIVDCATIARGITKAYKGMDLGVPVIVRLEGTWASYYLDILSWPTWSIGFIKLGFMEGFKYF